MYLHIGADGTVKLRRLVAILPARAGRGRAVRELLARAEARGQLHAVAAPAEAKSIVIADQGIYLSPVSPGALRRRVETGRYLEEASS